MPTRRSGRPQLVGAARDATGNDELLFERIASSEAMLSALVTVRSGTSESARATSVVVVPPVAPTVEPSSISAAAARAILRFSPCMSDLVAQRQLVEEPAGDGAAVNP